MDKVKAFRDINNVDKFGRIWGKLKSTELPTLWRNMGLGIMSELMYEEYRLDIFGNVISKNAEGQSLCAFVLDHVFPWSRGGRSVNQNIATIYWGAHNVKRAQILQVRIYSVMY